MIKEEAAPPDVGVVGRRALAAVAGGSAGGVLGGIIGGVGGGPPPPPPARAKGPLRVGGNVQQANLIRQVQPVYPPIAKTAHISGHRDSARDHFEGRQRSEAQYVSGPPLLMKNAMDAVHQWRYQANDAERRAGGSRYNDFCGLYFGRVKE